MGGRVLQTALTTVEEEEEIISSCEFLEIGCRISESDEEEVEEEQEESEGSLFSIEINENLDHDRVFVAVGKNESSMIALLWTLKHALTPPSTVVHLIHVFPAIRFIPSPFGGMFPKNQACPKVVKIYVDQQRDKRKKLLQTYVDACSAAKIILLVKCLVVSAIDVRLRGCWYGLNFEASQDLESSGVSTTIRRPCRDFLKVKVETSLVESDFAAKAILELIPTLNISKLVLGSNISSLRKVKSKKGTASQVIQNAPETCEIKIICKGKELNDQSNGSPSPHGSNANSSSTQEEDQEQALSSPDIRGSPSGMPISGQVWSVFKWGREKPTSTLGPSKPQPAISSFYWNLLK